jgi:hypothetical protein
MAAAANPGFFTQEEARATEAVAAASRGDDDGFGEATQDVDEEEEEHVQVDEEDDAPEPTSTAKGRKKRKKTSPPTELRVKWTGKEEECLAEAWNAILKLYPRTPGCDWNKSPTHARFTSNPGENIAGFRPGASNGWRCSKSCLQHHLETGGGLVPT